MKIIKENCAYFLGALKVFNDSQKNFNSQKMFIPQEFLNRQKKFLPSKLFNPQKIYNPQILNRQIISETRL